MKLKVLSFMVWLLAISVVYGQQRFINFGFRRTEIGNINENKPKSNVAAEPAITKTTDNHKSQAVLSKSSNETDVRFYYDPTMTKLNEKLSAIYAVQEHDSAKLDAMDYKLSNLDTTLNEKCESIRVDVRDVNRQLQGIEWSLNKEETALDLIKADIELLREEFESTRVSMIPKPLYTAPPHPPPTPANNNIPFCRPEVIKKLDGLAVLIGIVQKSVDSWKDMNLVISDNLTHIENTVKEIKYDQRDIPTKKYLTAALQGLKLSGNQGSGSSGYGCGGGCCTSSCHCGGGGNYGSCSGGGFQRPSSGPLSFDPRNQLPPNDDSRSSSTAYEMTPTSCKSIRKGPSGIYKIQPNPMKPSFYIYCDMKTENGGWTVIQKREDGKINFFQNWMDYRIGFGNIGSEYWIGLDKLHDMTSSELQELLIVAEDFNGVTKTARYRAFAIGDERDLFTLSVLGKYEGDAGDSLSYHAGSKFSTFDNDNDNWLDGNCAQTHSGGWWYNSCDSSNLNGRYFRSGAVNEPYRFHGIYWNDFHGSDYSMKSVKMMIRPIDRYFI